MEKIEFLSSIINGRIKVETCYKEYKKLDKSYNSAAFSFDYIAKRKDRYISFQINLYNYARALKDKKLYFEDFYKIEDILNEKIIPPNQKKYSKAEYTFFELYNCFRNRNEHYDKINGIEEYELFKCCVPESSFDRLLQACDEVVFKEISKLTDEERVKLYLNNIDVQISFENALNHLYVASLKSKDEYPEISCLNMQLYELMSSIKLADLSEVDLNLYDLAIRKVLTHKDYKRAIISEYGEDLYQKIIDVYDEENSSLDDDKEKIELIIKEIQAIELNKKDS